MLGLFSRQDIAEHVLRGPELIFDGDEMIGLLHYSRMSCDSTSDNPMVAQGCTDGEGNAFMTPVLWKKIASEVDQ